MVVPAPPAGRPTVTVSGHVDSLTQGETVLRVNGSAEGTTFFINLLRRFMPNCETSFRIMTTYDSETPGRLEGLEQILAGWIVNDTYIMVELTWPDYCYTVVRLVIGRQRWVVIFRGNGTLPTLCGQVDSNVKAVELPLDRPGRFEDALVGVMTKAGLPLLSDVLTSELTAQAEGIQAWLLGKLEPDQGDTEVAQVIAYFAWILARHGGTAEDCIVFEPGSLSLGGNEPAKWFGLHLGNGRYVGAAMDGSSPAFLTSDGESEPVRWHVDSAMGTVFPIDHETLEPWSIDDGTCWDYFAEQVKAVLSSKGGTLFF
jgi:hypothetical protein